MNFFLIYFFITTSLGFTEHQKLIIKSLINQFHIKNCILASNSENKWHNFNYFNDFKLLLGWNIFSNVKTPTQLYRYVHKDLFYHFSETTVGTKHKNWEPCIKLVMPKTLVIFQDSNVQSIIKLFMYESTISRSAPFFTWFAFLNKSEAQFLEKIKIHYNTEFIAAVKENDTLYTLNEIYISKEVFFLINYGIWDEENGLQVNQPELSFYQRRMNMNKIVITGTPLLKISDQAFNSYHLEVMKDMAKMMNSTFELKLKKLFREPPYDIYDLTYTMNDLTYVKDNVGPIITANSYLFIKEPNITTSNIYFLLPFSTHFLFALLTFITLITMFNILMHFIFKYKYSEDNIKWIDSAFKTFETFCSQSGGNLPTLYTSRIMDFTTNLLFMIILSAFSAVIQSHLIIMISPPPFHNLDELLRGKSYSLSAVYAGPEIVYFKQSRDPYYKNIYNMLYNARNSLEGGLRRACNERLAYIGYEFDVRNAKAECKLFKIRDPVLIRLSAIRFSQSTYGMKKAFDYKLLWFYSSGIVHKMQNDLKGFEKESSSSNYFPVEINQTQFVMAIIAAGTFLALILFIIEFIAMKCYQRKRVLK